MRNKLSRALSFALAVFLTLGLTGCGTSKGSGSGQSPAAGSSKDYDVVVVGAGLGGLTSAVAAAENGAKVALLEKLAFAGGNSILSTGIFYVGNTSIQRNAGIKDSAEAFYKEAMDKSGGKRDPEQVRMIADRGGETIDWLMSLGVKFSDKVTPVMGSSAPRAHQALPDASGPISALVKAAESKGVEIFYETPAVALITDGNGRVTGVEAKNKEGQVLKFNAKNVVLAVGGFAADPERLAKYSPAAKDVIYAGSPGTTGEMLDEALKLGADTVDLDVPWLTPTVEVDKKQLITSLVLSKGAILVNSQGQRFSDETASYAETAQKVLELGEPFVYEVFDSQVKELVYKVPEYIKKGMVTEAATLDELAEKMGVSADNLKATVAEYNKAVRKEQPDRFGREIFVEELKTAPFYFIKVKTGTIMTPGGLKINADCQVVNKNGSVIPGLYAVGETTGGYRAYGYIGGDSLTHAAVTGKVAGTNAAKK